MEGLVVVLVAAAVVAVAVVIFKKMQENGTVDEISEGIDDLAKKVADKDKK